jgi:hypothetical protein
MAREQGREMAGVLFEGRPPSRAVRPDLMRQTIEHLFGAVREMVDEQGRAS